jgi:hypothetical protein
MTAESRPRLHQEARTGLQFFIEAFGAGLLLFATTFFAHRSRFAPGALDTVVQLLPVAAVWLLLLTMYRHYRRIDELQRLKFLQSIALTAGALLGFVWSWPSLQHAFGWQLPDFAMLHVHASILFVVISALLTKVRAQPR